MMMQLLSAASATVKTELREIQPGHIEHLLERFAEWGITAGKHILIALLIFAVGRMLIKFLNHIVARMLARRHVDAGVQTFLKSLVNILLMVLLVVTVISALGINTTSFAALLASAGVAVGMALSGNLQNFAGGLVILLFKPYRVGDWIEAQGVQGKVREIQIFHTVMTMVDNKVVFIPNGSLSNSVIINYTREQTRRIEWTIGIDYGESVDKARAAIIDALNADDRVLKEPAPFVAVSALADSSVNLVVRVWVKNENYWPVYHETFARIYAIFNERGIDFPFPQQTVHIAKD